MSLLVVGSVAYDTIETPTNKVDNALGGSATYISIAASYFTEPVHLVGVVGDDFKKEHIELLKNRNVDLTGLQIIEGGKTFRWGGKYYEDFNQRDTHFTELNCFETFDPIIPDDQRKSEFVILGNIHPSLQMNVLEQMGSNNTVILDTMNLWIDISRNELLDVIKKSDILIINDSEAKMLVNETNLIKAANKIKELGPKYFVIKKGEHGALLFGEDKIFSAPAFPIADLFDPTGAGDCFAGGFTGYLCKSGDLSFENMKKAVLYGSVAASYCCEAFSTDGFTGLTENDIEERYNTFIELSQVK